MIADRESYIFDLLSIHPLDEVEGRDIQEVVEWLGASLAVHKPTNMDQHLGVMFFVFSINGEETFLMHHKKAGTWLPPGGHVKEGQGFAEAVMEEMQEEIGISLPLIVERPYFFVKTLTVGKNAGHIDATAYFIAQAETSVELIVEEKEASAGRWFPVKEIIGDESFVHLHRPLRKALEILNV